MIGFTATTMLVEKTDRLYRNLKDWVTVDESVSAAVSHRPVTLIVPWPPGGGTDIGMRALAAATESTSARKS